MIVVKTANKKSSKICSQFANDERPETSDYFSIGSALILTVVLTTLLATIGVLFVLLSRIDKMAASAASENREINSAVETVVAKIKQELVSDVPGVAGEYYDYPGLEDKWLASLEPCQVAANNYRWPQISDVYNKLGPNLWLQAAIVPDYQDAKIMGEGQIADADGDGVADSRWVVIPDVNSSKGRPIYAAIRIIDNGGTLNVNTAYKFDPTDPCATRIDIDGSSQRQINLAALSQRGANGTLAQAAGKLQTWRCGTEPTDLLLYEQNVIWRYDSPNGAYTPFDISDELELRNRFLLNQNDAGARIDARVERFGWTGSFIYNNIEVPIGSGGSNSTIDDWFKRANISVDPNFYDYRHIATTCNMDRIINPAGPAVNNGWMVNVNTADKSSLYGVIYARLRDANFPGNWVETAAQLAVNLIDYRDSDDYVTSFAAPDGKIYYGFERPCIYISELDYNSVTTGSPPTPHTTYAVELYKPYSEDSIPRPNRPDSWQLVVDGAAIDIDPSPPWFPGKSFCVIRNQDPSATITVDPNAVVQNSGAVILASTKKIELQRKVTDPNGASKYIAVDSILVPNWLVTGQGLRSYQRDITRHKCIRRLWDSAAKTPTLGSINSYVDSSTGLIQARPANRSFTNIGEIGTIFQMSVYSQGPNPIKPTDNEFTARLNLINPAFQQIFNYLTVIDPAGHGQPSSETRIKGRINVNTAPWFVIAQLPWMQSSIARAIVGYRDTAAKGFRSIGELMNVAEMDYYGNQNLQPGNLTGFPDLTPNDGAADDFEERDVIFARISNLVTVRSDVFTAYILVRIGANGPQRRVIAILDRSKVTSPTDKVKIIAIQPVPDPR
jgi:hypothetical protein